MGIPLREQRHVTVGYGAMNPNAVKGRERRGKSKPKSKFTAPKGGQRGLFMG